MKKITFLLSNGGTGSNLQAVIDAIEKERIKAKIVVVVSDTPEAFGLQRAKKHGIPQYISGKKEDLAFLLKEKYHVDFVCLGGWKRIIPGSMLEAFHNRILNIHPGLIPDTIDGIVQNPDGTVGLWNKGNFTDVAIQNFLDTKATYAGSTVHFLSKEFDFGPVLGRCFVKVLPNDTVDSLYERLKPEEHKIYAEALVKLCG